MNIKQLNAKQNFSPRQPQVEGALLHLPIPPQSFDSGEC